MNIAQELSDIIKEYIIGGYKTKIIVTEDNYIEEVWKGNPRFKRGKFRTWYINGNLRSEVNYVYGRVYGTLKSWYPNGNLRVMYDNGYLTADGIKSFWHEDGKISSVSSFVDHKHHGIFKYYQYMFGGIVKIYIEEYCRGESINRKEIIRHYLENRDEYYTGIAGPNQGVHDRVQNN